MSRFSCPAVTLVALAAISSTLIATGAHAGLDSTLVERLGPTYLEGYTNVLLLRAEGRYEEALDLTRRSLETYIINEDLNPGWILDCREGLHVLEAVVAFPPRARRRMEVADSLSIQIQFDWADGRFQRGMERTEHRLEIHAALFGPEHREVARSLHDLGKFQHALGEIDEAEDLYRRALDILFGQQEASDVEIAETVQFLGELLYYNGALAEAERLQRQALGLRVSALGENDEVVDRSRLEIAQIQIDRGEYALAEPLLRRALFSCRERWGGDHWLNATLIDNLGLVLDKQGDYVGAERLYEDGLALRRRLLGSDHPHIVRSLRALGLNLQRQGKGEMAEARLREALQKQRSLLGGEHLETVSASRDLALLLRSRGDLEGAERLVHEALAIKKKALGERHPEVADDLTHLGSIQLEQGKPREAIASFEGALEILADVVDQDHPRATAALEGIAVGRLRIGDPAAAQPILSKLAQSYEAARLLAGSGFVRATFRSSPYLYLASAELLLGHEKEAWVAAEMGLGRALADLLVSSDRWTEGAAGRDSDRDVLLEQVSKLERQVSILEDSATEDSRSKLEQARTELLAAEAAWLDEQREAGSRKPEDDVRGISLESIQAVIPERTAIVGWIDPDIPAGGSACYGYVIRNRGPVHWVSLDHAVLEDGDRSISYWAEEFRHSLAMAGSWFFRLDETARINALAARVWESWVEPLTPNLQDVDHLVVLPCEPLLGVPLEALVDDQGRYLTERYAISYAPSATVYAWLKERSARGPSDAMRKVLLVGDPPFSDTHRATMAREVNNQTATLHAPTNRPDPLVLRSALAGDGKAIADLPRLPKSREEIESIAAVTEEELILLGPEASEQALARLASTGALREFDTIHLATHALVDEEFPERSALILSQTDLPDPYEAVLREERVFDGLLSLKEIAREWVLDADLVTLSGCQTALGRRTRGEGLIGLQQAFLQVGARNVVLSLWKVDDSATSLLMGRFYENLARADSSFDGRSPAGPVSMAESLREAKQWLRGYTDKDGDHPFVHPVYWSGFILVGCDDS